MVIRWNTMKNGRTLNIMMRAKDRLKFMILLLRYTKQSYILVCTL